MSPHLSLTQITLIVGGAVVTGGLLVFMVYGVHKLFQGRRSDAEIEPKPARPEDERTFAMATMQSVIAGLKGREKELQQQRLVAEQRARETARISENIIREMPSGLMVFNREGFITAANPAVRTLLGTDLWSRRRYPEIVGQQSTLAAYLRECLEAGRTFARETIEYRTPRGDTRVLGISLSPFHAAGGELDGAICLLTDLTEIRQLQEQMRLKEHLAALGEMAAGIAHEFKNSLATLSGYAQLLRDGKLSGEDRQFAERIVNEVRSLTQVVTDFLTLSKPFTLTFRPVKLESLMGQVVENLRQTEGFSRINFRLEGSFPALEGDEVLLRQAFANLLRNCCEAMTTQENDAGVIVRGETLQLSGRDYVRVLVSDSGKGIPPEERDKIFIPFFTTKPAGSGLGLALVQKIVFSHDGQVSLESSSPQGTTFSVLLPLRAAAGNESSPEDASTPKSVRS